MKVIIVAGVYYGFLSFELYISYLTQYLEQPSEGRSIIITPVLWTKRMSPLPQRTDLAEPEFEPWQPDSLLHWILTKVGINEQIKYLW